MSGIESLVERIRRFNERRGWRSKHVPAHLAQSIAIEAAELLECFQWLDQDESTRLALNDKAFRAAMSTEIADIVIYAIGLCDRTDIDLEQAILEKLELNESRFRPKDP